jgi:hypothetical protein
MVELSMQALKKIAASPTRRRWTRAGLLTHLESEDP